MNLNELHIKDLLSKLKDSSKFKAWFKNSKVVDKNDNPLICYHFTTVDFKLAKPFSHFGSSKSANDVKNNLYAGLSGGRILSVFLSIQNPMNIPDLCSHFYLEYYHLLVNGKNGNYKSINEPKYIIFSKDELPNPFNYKISENEKMSILQRKLLEKGIDGFKYINEEEDIGEISWIILKPAQAMPVMKIIGLIPLNEQKVFSSWIDDISFYPIDNSIDMTVKTGQRKKYKILFKNKNIFDDWLKAGSKGKWWHNKIKPV